MGKHIQVDPAKLRQAAAKLEDLSANYGNIAKNLMNDASSMGAAWQGEDNQAFVTQITGFAEELNQMATKLATGAETLIQQASNYEQRQDAIISAVKNLSN